MRGNANISQAVNIFCDMQDKLIQLAKSVEHRE